MDITRRRALALATAFAGTAALPARAQQNWPQRPLRILVGTSPGGSPDIIGRLLADKMAERLGQTITVENNTGGGGGIAASMVTHAPPDGYNHDPADGGLCQRRRGRQIPVRRRQHLRLSQHGVRLSVRLFGAEGIADQVVPRHAGARQGRARQDDLLITSLGSVYHLIGSWVGSKAGIDMVPVPYRGSANAVTDVMAGRVDVMLDTATSGFPRITSGQFRALAVTSPERYPLLPDAPTVAETLPGVQLHVLARHGGRARARRGRSSTGSTPNSIARWRCPKSSRSSRRAAISRRRRTPEAMRKQIADEIANWKQIIEANNIKVN